MVFASIFSWVNSNAIMTERNNQYNMSENAAESAVERVIGQMDRDFIFANISSAGTYAPLPGGVDQSGWPIQYSFTGTNLADTSAGANSISVVFAAASSSAVPMNSQFTGLYGLAQAVDVCATAAPIGQRYTLPATVHESLQFASIPLFQYAIFYNVNLEIDPGAAMTVTGPVFSNQSIWEGSSVCTFASSVAAVGTNCTGATNPFAMNYAGTGTSTFAGGPPINNANSLVMPIGTDNSPTAILALLALPPAIFTMGSAAAYSSAGTLYPANGADLVITNFVSGTNCGNALPFGTNMIAFLQDNSLAPLPYDYYMITNGNLHKTFITNFISATLLGTRTNIYFAGYSWVTNVAFYDWREGWNGGSGPAKRVEAVQINIALLNRWLTNNSVSISGSSADQAKLLHAGHHIDSVYVYNSVALSGTVLPAVRLSNGKMLPNPGGSTAGFTVATPFPIYVLGDYNAQNPSGSSLGLNSTAYTYPAALMGDSVTILSDNWSDNVTTTMPTPASTTVNAAMLEGIVPSNPSLSGNYSGGVENFMRLLENWNGMTLTYNGSIVVLFYSQFATNSWLPTGNYYNPPTRNWAFDVNFRQSSKLPPLTPSIKAMIRGTWRVQ